MTNLGQSGSWTDGDFLWPSEETPTRIKGWLSRQAIPDGDEACAIVAHELGVSVDRVQLRPMLMREESEVEARINGHEMPYLVECTRRAKQSQPYWCATLAEDDDA